MDSKLVLQIVSILLVPVILILAYVVKNYVRPRLSTEMYNSFTWTVDKIVEGIEQEMSLAAGSEKMAKAMEILGEIARHNGVDIGEDHLRFLIGYAVKTMNENAEPSKSPTMGFVG